MDGGQSRDNVVPFKGERGDMRFPAIAQVRAYWEALRAGRLVPLRSEIDPRGIERALEYAFVLERVAPSVARFRLAGVHLNDLMGMEVRGMPLTALLTPGARTQLAEMLEGVFRGPQIAEVALAAEKGWGKPELDAKLLILPLRSDLGDLTRALGCLVSDGRIGRAPRRFDILSAKVTPVVAGRHADCPAPARGFAEDSPAFAGPPGAERGYLRLVRMED